MKTRLAAFALAMAGGLATQPASAADFGETVPGFSGYVHEVQYYGGGNGYGYGYEERRREEWRRRRWMEERMRRDEWRRERWREDRRRRFYYGD